MKGNGRRQKKNGGDQAPGGFLEGAVRLFGRGLTAVGDMLSSSDTDALEMLRAQHKHVDKLFKQIEGALEHDAKRALPLIRELADALTWHAEIEERHFYPGIRTEKTEDLVKESFEEHAQMKRALADVLSASKRGGGEGNLAATVKVLKEEVVHHAKEEEEKKLFPLVKTILDEDQREALGQEMLATLVELEQSGFRLPARTLRGEQPAPA